MRLSEDSVRDFTVFLGYLYMREGCFRRVEGDRLMRVCLCVIMRVYSRVEVQRTRYYKTAIFRGNAVWAYEGETNGSTGYHGCRGNDLFEQRLSKDSLHRTSSYQVELSGRICWQHQRFRVMFKARFCRSFKLASTSGGNSGEEESVGEIMMRDLQGMQRYTQEREDCVSCNKKTAQVGVFVISSVGGTDGFFRDHKECRLSYRKMTNGSCSCTACSSFSEVVRVTWKVSGCKKKARIVTSQCGRNRLYLHEEATRAMTKCVKAYTRVCWRKWLFVVTECSSFSDVVRNRVEQVVTTGCNPEDKGYETTVISTCSRSRKSLPQLVEACVSYTLEESSWMPESEIQDE
ncbi:hypothetical protein DY000_02052241 [Brassica cretica]|uniref:Uncharacterized protein n=1 Tax=Brassica cretica TaxID=69181 RepID=A0ABQ7A9H9_BRACR|nr:hypothetical protein DY000_02052241 [Brassica cretica]